MHKKEIELINQLIKKIENTKGLVTYNIHIITRKGNYGWIYKK